MAVLLGTVLLVACLASTKADFAVIAPHDVTGTWRHSVTLPCTYSPVDHAPQRTVWLFDDRRLFERDEAGDHVFVTRYRERLSLPQDRQGSNVSLTIVNLEIDDGGVYTCKVSLMLPGSSNLITKEASTHLIVRKVAVTIPVVQPDGSLFEVFEGTMLRFTCFAEGSPPITYSWYKRGMEGTRDYFQTNEPSFIIKSAQSSDSGTYYCEVENKIPKKTTKKSQVFELNITGAAVSTTTNPQIRMGSTERMTTTEHSQSIRYREHHGTSAPSSTKGPGVSSGSSLLLIIMVIVLSMGVLVILVGLLVTRCKRRKRTDGIYGIPTMSELNARANQDVPIVNVCQLNISPINISENNSCPTSDMRTLRMQNDYQPVMTSDDQKPGNDCHDQYANVQNEYEILLNER
ncbi:V-set and immunoglobulin domain-containing protein 4-like isoform X2 [Pleurodeles waltl]|uniref:V-set and immunoglobulin domain-containing protein 4-like isoform X2 n=1 Tax=Pleurodeles waltl TaxID=8319 RepID=UPI0037096BBC